jgi:formate dehydrogenase gamma subunit
VTEASRKYLRFPVPERIEHWLFVLSFATLALTGLVQKFATGDLSTGIIAVLGGIETVRRIHRIAAVSMMLETVYHIGVVGYKLYVRRVRMSMLPTFTDVRIAWRALLYNLGMGKDKPQQGRFTFEEKVEYWAVVWGTLVMAITGFMMWNPIATTRFLPGDFVPAAKAAHGGEALLAVLAIIVWHLYHVHLRHFNRSMFTGHLTEEEMLEEHPLELADIKAGAAGQPPDPVSLSRRRRVYSPIYAVLALVMLLGIYAFVSFEQTAITTIPPAEDVVVFVPLTPTPLPTPLPTQPPAISGVPTTWSDGVEDLFGERCGLCHGELGGLNLSTYAQALQGGESGPAFVPGDPDASALIVIQSAGDHPGQLSGEELAWIRTWIEAGAPE